MAIKKLKRWNEEETKFLTDYYKYYGNTEIARRLNLITSRKKFTARVVEKKMRLLNLKRTEEELYNIMAEIGRNSGRARYNKICNENTMFRIWEKGKIPYRYIRINGIFVSYTRWYYKNFIGPIPENHIIIHLDGNSLNDRKSNLRCVARKGGMRPSKKIGLNKKEEALPCYIKKKFIKNGYFHWPKGENLIF